MLNINSNLHVTQMDRYLHADMVCSEKEEFSNKETRENKEIRGTNLSLGNIVFGEAVNVST